MKATNIHHPCSSIFEKAKYIKAEMMPPDFSLYAPAPLFRKEFEVEEIGAARIFVQSPGFARYYINGKDITDDLFISATSDYTKILLYNEYDVTHLLTVGKNVIAVITGNGFLNESFETNWNYHIAAWRDAPKFLLRLCIDEKTAIVSDGSWKCSRDESHIIYNHLRSGEYWDMRKKNDAWLKVGYDDSDWQSAIEQEEYPTEALRPTTCQPIREVERIAPVSITETARGYLADFGKTLSGYLDVSLCEERGREIRFYYAEDIDSEGAPKHNKMDLPIYYKTSPFHINKMIASGGEDRFKPMFSYHGFRYVLIEGLSRKPRPEDLCACFIHQDVERRSDFESGNEILNFIYNAGIRSTYSNMFWCLTDCPTREKLGWTNDASASLEQVLINFDAIPLLQKWYEDIKVAMFDDGSLVGTIPSPDWAWGHGCGPVCDCFLFELPYRVYLYTANAEMLIEGIPFFERYVAFLEKKVSEGHEFILGDWMSSDSTAVPKTMLSELYLMKAYDITALAHSVAKTNCDKWAARRDAWRRTLSERYIDVSGRCTVNAQTAVSMMIEMKIGDISPLADQLVSLIEGEGYRFRCGMVGIQYIFFALSRIGRGDLAYRIMTETTPGYRSWFEKGETTLWEKWDGENHGSHNHHMLSGVIAWFYRNLLGISPSEDKPGFEEIELRPDFIKDIGYAKCSMSTARGRIDAEWRYTDGGFAYTVRIPGDVKAVFRGNILNAGTNDFFIPIGDNI